MNTIVDLELSIDVQDAYDQLDNEEKDAFLSDNISDLSNDNLLEELANRRLFEGMIEILENNSYAVMRD